MTATKAPLIDWSAISPLLALTAGACIVLLIGLSESRAVRQQLVSVLTIAAFATAGALGIWQWNADVDVISRALRIDGLTVTLLEIIAIAGIAATALSWREHAAEESGHGEYHSLMLFSALGMVVLVGAQNLITLFVGFELLSIPLYVLCASSLRRASSLESGLKYLIVGSVGSATLLYGLAFVYGATGSTNFRTIDLAVPALRGDFLFLGGLSLVAAGLAFKASIAPFHQWAPDVYEGAPTPITAFMATATKVAAFGVLLRVFDVAFINSAVEWAPALAVLATVTIIVGNVGALGQSSLKRLLAYSSVAQAGYILAGLVVSTKLGVQAAVFYLAAYLFMNFAAFSVIVIRERETRAGDDISTLYGLGMDRPLLAWPMTLSMLALAGFPATAGFFGKIYLIDAAVSNQYAWLGVVIVLGSALSLAYYLRVVAAVWMRSPDELAPVRPALAGSGSSQLAPPASNPEAPDPPDPQARWAGVVVALMSTIAVIFFGIFPQPLFEFARHAGEALTELL